MQYEQGSEKVVPMASPYKSVSQPLSLAEDFEIRRTRKILLIMLGVCLGLAVIGAAGAIGAIAGHYITNSTEYTTYRASIVQSFSSIVFFGFGYLVTHRYSRIGLQVFAWISIIELVIVGIALVLLVVFSLVFLTITNSTHNYNSWDIMVPLSIFVYIMIVFVIAACILRIVIVKFAFKLARLIETRKSSFCQHI
ncbi:unnamed protein product [Rotaria socialis]|uniref:Uncharacterized protein n=1 Tax=Rotaria socialis TaxID=392032 RepID=A0A817YLF2_9BILA|nr:unnamed protein product [Rotaria socialis]CAF3379926.1 unnamed protein product [Rotaria socialis]CAF4532092.1 unnamed protein product [Rotaria socialis]